LWILFGFFPKKFWSDRQAVGERQRAPQGPAAARLVLAKGMAGRSAVLSFSVTWPRVVPANFFNGWLNSKCPARRTASRNSSRFALLILRPTEAGIRGESARRATELGQPQKPL